MEFEKAQTNLDFALAYAKKGWHVFPLHSIRNGKCTCSKPECKKPGKHPRTEHGLNESTTDEQQIIEWWKKMPDANVGVRTGEVSGICVLDIDRDKGGFYSVEEFTVPATLYSKTGGDGEHKILQYDAKVPTTVAFRPGIDFRSDGGYIVAPPSNHISGKNYVWCDEFLEPAPAPDWMKNKGEHKSAPPIPEIILDGQRNALLTSLAGSMRRRGASQVAIEKALLEENKRCDPPLEEEEVLGIAKSISRYEPHQEGKDVTNSRLLSEYQIDQIKKKIQSIPKDSDPLAIPALLDAILREIADLNIAQGDALLKHTIKEHFDFTNDDLKSYEKVLKDYRKDPKDDKARKSLSKSELIEILHDEQGNMTIHPAQDYKDGMMVFTVKVKDLPCLITSDRRLFSLQDAPQEGFVIKHDTVDTSRFSAKGVTTFLDGKYEISILVIYEKIYGYVKRFIHFPDEEYLNYISLWAIALT